MEVKEERLQAVDHVPENKQGHGHEKTRRGVKGVMSGLPFAETQSVQQSSSAEDPGRSEDLWLQLRIGELAFVTFFRLLLSSGHRDVTYLLQTTGRRPPFGGKRNGERKSFAMQKIIINKKQINA
jgi:hypothetical protein